jgi:hypothetical protein
MPAMAPGESIGELEEVVLETEVAEAVGSGVIVVVVIAEDAVGLEAGTISAGLIIPGLNINVAFLANSCCVWRSLVGVGLMTPIMPSFKQAPGAEQ